MASGGALSPAWPMGKPSNIKTVEVNKERAQAAQECLEFNKHMDVVHVASDLNCFGNKSDAINHARGLADKTLDVFNRDTDGTVEHDIVDTYMGTQAAKTIPDADLAQAKNKGKAKGESFAKVKKADVKDPAIKYGTETSEAKPKKAAAKKAAAPKVVATAQQATEQSAAATQSTEPSITAENQQ